MGRRKKTTGSKSTSQLDTNEAKPVSNRRSRKGKNKEANVFLKDLLRPGALSDFRIEVRKTSTEDGKGSGYERFVRLRNEWSPVSSSTVKPNFTCANRTESSPHITDRKLPSDGPSASVLFSDNPKLKKHYSDYGRVQTSHGKTSSTRSPDRRKSCESEVKKSALKSPRHQGNRRKSCEQQKQSLELTGKKSVSAPPTPIRHLLHSGKGKAINRGDSQAWASHPYVSHFEGQGETYLEQHSHCPQGQGSLLPGGLHVEQLKNALSELLRAAQLGKPMLEHHRSIQERESAAGDTTSLPVPNWVRNTHLQGDHSRPMNSSYNSCEGGSMQSPYRMPFNGYTFGGHYGEGVPGLLQIVHGLRSTGQGDHLPMPKSWYSGRSPEFRGPHELRKSQDNEPFSNQKGGSRKRPGSPLPDQSRRQPRLDQERVGVSWMDMQGKSGMDQDRGNSSHYAGSSSPHQCQSKSLSGHKMKNYDSMQTHHDTITLNKSHSPKNRRHFGKMSSEPFSLKNYGSAGASPTSGGKSSTAQRLEKATVVNRPMVRFRESKFPIKRSNSSSPEAHQEEVPTGRYKWEYFGTNSSNAGKEEQFQDAHSSFKSGMLDFSPSTKFSPKFKASKSDISIQQSATRMGPSTAMIGVQSTTALSDTSDQASIGRGGGVGHSSFRGRGFFAHLGCRANLPVTQLGEAGDGVKRSASASSSLRDVRLSNLEALIRGNDKSLGEAVALDCEMVGAGKKGSCSMVGRVAVVNHNGHILLDSMVAPTMPVTDYRTPFSGIRKRDLIGAPSFASVKSKVVDLVTGRILVGHDIQNDLKVLNLTHPMKSIRDTSNYYFAPFRKIPNKSRSKLKTMFQLQTGGTYTIQTGEHCPVEDARAAMMLYQLNKTEWEASLRDSTS